MSMFIKDIQHFKRNSENFVDVVMVSVKRNMLLQQSTEKNCHEAFEILQLIYRSQIIRILKYTPVWLLTLQKMYEDL